LAQRHRLYTGGSNFKIDHHRKCLRILLAWYFEFAEIEEQFEVNLFQGLVQVLAVKQKSEEAKT